MAYPAVAVYFFICHFLSIRNRDILMVENRSDEVVGIPYSTILGFLMMTEILKVRRLVSGAQHTNIHIRTETVFAHIPGS